LVEHMGELRRRIVLVIVVFIVSLCIGLVATEKLIVYLSQSSPANGIAWNVFSPWDVIKIYMQFAFVFALILTIPFAMHQLWLFVSPGRHNDEKKTAIQYIPWAFILFIAGLSFAYFVIFPLAIQFTTMMASHLNMTETYGVAQYFSFMFSIVLPIALLF